MSVNFFELFGASFFIVTLTMTILWGFNVFYKNTTFVDLGWALGFVLSSWAFALLGDGFWFKRLVINAMVTLWGLRLFGHLFQRFDKNREDPRYTALKEKFGNNLSEFKIYMMFLFQGFLVILLSLPFVIVSTNATTSFHLIEIIGVLVFLVGLLGESLADLQLDAFKKDPKNAGLICDQGLWRYTRHPNYFFEWIVWIGYFLFALGTPWGFLAILSPMIIYILVRHVSGVPLAEEQSLKNKPEKYKEYMKKTKSAFWPSPF